MFNVPMSVLPEVRDSAGSFGTRPAVAPRPTGPGRGRCRRRSSDRLVFRRRCQEHLWHRPSGAEYRAAAGSVHTVCSYHNYRLNGVATALEGSIPSRSGDSTAAGRLGLIKQRRTWKRSQRPWPAAAASTWCRRSRVGARPYWTGCAAAFGIDARLAGGNRACNP
jgi:hypothetical protein